MPPSQPPFIAYNIAQYIFPTTPFIAIKYWQYLVRANAPTATANRQREQVCSLLSISISSSEL